MSFASIELFLYFFIVTDKAESSWAGVKEFNFHVIFLASIDHASSDVKSTVHTYISLLGFLCDVWIWFWFTDPCFKTKPSWTGIEESNLWRHSPWEDGWREYWRQKHCIPLGPKAVTCVDTGGGIVHPVAALCRNKHKSFKKTQHFKFNWNSINGTWLCYVSFFSIANWLSERLIV